MSADAPADVADATAEEAQPANEWEALLSAATLEDVRERKSRVKVEVPDAVLNLVKDARAKNKRILLPYNAEKFEELSAWFYAAGDLMEPKGTIMVKRLILDDKKETIVKDDTATHLRVYVGERRGRSKAKDKASTEQKTPEQTTPEQTSSSEKA